jgi:hypothetical protein
MLPEILPDVSWNEHLRCSLEMVPEKSSVDFAFGVLLHDVPATRVRFLSEDLRMSGSETQHILGLVSSLPKFKELPSSPVHAIKRFVRMPRFEDHLELARICALASDRDLSGYNFATKKLQEWSADDIAPAPLVSGDDLIGMGFSPGPLFKEILNTVEDEQLDGRLSTTQQAKEFVRENYKK